MIVCFDIDGTICSNTEGEYEKAEVRPEVVAILNRLYDEGNTIYLYTARGSTTGIDWRNLTEDQLKSWGVRFHRVFFGKPTADLYVDDKCVNVNDWLKKEKTH